MNAITINNKEVSAVFSPGKLFEIDVLAILDKNELRLAAPVRFDKVLIPITIHKAFVVKDAYLQPNGPQRFELYLDEEDHLFVQDIKIIGTDIDIIPL